MWPWRVEARAEPGHLGAAAWQTSGCALGWVGLLSERGDRLSLSLWPELKPGLSRAPSSFRPLISQYFVASCVLEQLQRRLGHSASCTPTGSSGYFYRGLPSRSSLCPVPTRCLLWTSWEPASLLFPRLYECRCAASPCPCPAGVWPAQVAPHPTPAPAPAGLLCQLGWAQAGLGGALAPELLGAELLPSVSEGPRGTTLGPR